MNLAPAPCIGFLFKEADNNTLRETWQVTEAHTLANVHPESECQPPCVIHAPTNHRMESWPLYWRDDAKKFERHCEHGIGHPDPDDQGHGIHGCDGCCTP